MASTSKAAPTRPATPLRIWRLTRTKHAASAFDGEGAALRGGRWNDRAVRATYASLDPSTTVLETLTTFRRALAPPEGFTLIGADYTGSLLQIALAALPRSWNHPENPEIARATARSFFKNLDAGALIVPSVTVPESLNLILNPLHPDADPAKLKNMTDRPFEFDPRWPLI